MITQSVYRFDGAGHLDPTRPSHVWVLDVPAEGQTAEPKQLTSGEFAEDDLAWSPDGSTVFFTTNRMKDPSYASPDADLYSVPRAGRGAEARAVDRRPHRRLRAFLRRPARRLHRLPEPEGPALLRPAGPVRGRPARRRREEPQHGFRQRRGRRDHRRPARAPGRLADAPRLDPRPALRDREDGGARPRQPPEIQRGPGNGGGPDHGRPGGARLLGQRRRLRPGGRGLDPHGGRRPLPGGRHERPDARRCTGPTRSSSPGST